MRELISLARSINELSITGTAVVKSQRLHDPVVGGVAPVGIRYEGRAMPKELTDYIGGRHVDVDVWHADGVVKCFVSPK